MNSTSPVRTTNLLGICRSDGTIKRPVNLPTDSSVGGEAGLKLSLPRLLTNKATNFSSIHFSIKTATNFESTTPHTKSA